MEDERAQGPEDLEDGEELPRNAVLWTGCDGCTHEHSSYGYLHAMNPARWARRSCRSTDWIQQVYKNKWRGRGGGGGHVGSGRERGSWGDTIKMHSMHKHMHADKCHIYVYVCE